MKNKFITLSIITLSFFVISSCKKKSETCKLGKYHISDGSNTPNPNVFSYYSDGRLQKVTYDSRVTDSLVYRADTIEITTLNSDGITVAVFTGVLNSFGFVTEGEKTYFDVSGNVTATETYSLQYNSEGRLLQKSVNTASGLTLLSFTYEGSNTAEGTLFVAGALDRKFTFYHNNAENKTEIDDFNSALTPYFGKGSKNLLDSTRIITTAADTIRIQYYHKLDANNYVSKTVQTYLTQDADTKYFTYQYFDCSK